ncbi:hypothetical protein BJ508DRAFT_419764 [Ascobolus immersus RN42]|uniref:EF-hand domain-containing protein n=1 Tax=Ascobolus immersus RN42 TaxID=1160509 RepID=A0A3N4HBI8_ASCIM|nr:hypothetical protein BJ508DRAFT_419764 [Ascobolus immersus RN42]
MRGTSLLVAALAVGVAGHGSHGGDHDRDPNRMSWAEMHMEEEHHVSNFDPGAFFSLHDFDNSGTWTRGEILRTYGLSQPPDQDPTDPANKVTAEQKDALVKDIMKRMDYDNDNAITMEEFKHYHEEGGQLPDYGYGPGHHGDDEYEYELHHYERFHGDDTTDEELTHPEDIAHFAKHEREEREAERQEELEKQAVNVGNIPDKFKNFARGY